MRLSRKHALSRKELPVFSTLYIKTILCSLCLVALLTQSALAVPTITVTGSGSEYSVMGSGMDGIHGIELTVVYDSTLGMSTVSQGGLVSGATMIANTNNAGSIRIAIASPVKSFNGSGQIVGISMASKAGSGGIKSCSYLLVTDTTSINGQCTIPGSGNSDTNSPGLPFQDKSIVTPPPSGSTGTITVNTPPPASLPVSLGTVITTGDSQPKSEPKPADIVTAPTHQAESSDETAPLPPVDEKKSPEPQRPRESKTISPKSALDQFDELLHIPSIE